MDIARSTKELGRRRVPRRDYEAPIGLLVDGVYTVERCYQVGEGGMMISSERPLKELDPLVISFFVFNKSIVVRGEVRSVTPGSDHSQTRYGIEFLGLGFVYKREIRNLVASAGDQK
jgi:hypothetical protein